MQEAESFHKKKNMDWFQWGSQEPKITRARTQNRFAFRSMAAAPYRGHYVPLVPRQTAAPLSDGAFNAFFESTWRGLQDKLPGSMDSVAKEQIKKRNKSELLKYNQTIGANIVNPMGVQEALKKKLAENVQNYKAIGRRELYDEANFNRDKMRTTIATFFDGNDEVKKIFDEEMRSNMMDNYLINIIKTLFCFQINTDKVAYDYEQGKTTMQWKFIRYIFYFILGSTYITGLVLILIQYVAIKNCENPMVYPTSDIRAQYCKKMTDACKIGFGNTMNIFGYIELRLAAYCMTLFPFLLLMYANIRHVKTMLNDFRQNKQTQNTSMTSKDIWYVFALVMFLLFHFLVGLIMFIIDVMFLQYYDSKEAADCRMAWANPDEWKTLYGITVQENGLKKAMVTTPKDLAVYLIVMNAFSMIFSLLYTISGCASAFGYLRRLDGRPSRFISRDPESADDKLLSYYDKLLKNGTSQDEAIQIVANGNQEDVQKIYRQIQQRYSGYGQGAPWPQPGYGPGFGAGAGPMFGPQGGGVSVGQEKAWDLPPPSRQYQGFSQV